MKLRLADHEDVLNNVPFARIVSILVPICGLGHFSQTLAQTRAGEP
jgi:hypothetical protein